MSEGWKSQYTVMLDWRNRMSPWKPTDNSGLVDLKSYQEHLHAFFVNCYHLSDALIKDQHLSKKDLDSFVASSVPLGVCQGICDSAKHYEVDRPHQSTYYREYWRTDSADYWLKSSTGDFQEISDLGLELVGPGTYIFKTDKSEHEAERLANECIAAWEAFLRDNHLVPPRTRS